MPRHIYSTLSLIVIKFLTVPDNFRRIRNDDKISCIRGTYLSFGTVLYLPVPMVAAVQRWVRERFLCVITIWYRMGQVPR
jgi:hypothetical protein